MTVKDIVNIVLVILGMLALAAIGFFIGRATVKKTIEKEIETVYVEGPVIHDTISTLKPIKVIVPCDTVDVIKYCVDNNLFPELLIKHDTTYIDTTAFYDAIVNDWMNNRYYSETLFDEDTLGSCTVDMIVTNNRLKTLEYKYSPKIKYVERTYENTRKISPFVGAGISTAPSVVGQGGIFFEERYGVSALYQYQWETKQHIWGATFLYKF